MIGYMCIVKHDEAKEQYGDCLRACVASVVEINPKHVPHFMHDNPTGDVANNRVSEYLGSLGLVPFWVFYDGSTELEEIFELMNAHNPDVHYLLFCRSSTADHVVVCQGGRVVHDPAWVRGQIQGCGSSGFWGIMVIARK